MKSARLKTLANKKMQYFLNSYASKLSMWCKYMVTSDINWYRYCYQWKRWNWCCPGKNTVIGKDVATVQLYECFWINSSLLLGNFNELFLLEIFITLHSCSFESIISLNGSDTLFSSFSKMIVTVLAYVWSNHVLA